jgi:ubiquitin carboxyl-terminal hydrolase 8
MQYFPKGLNNTGNTCYLNAGTQMLLQNVDFCNTVITNHGVNDDMEKLAKFIEAYRQAPHGSSLTPDIIKNILGERHMRFRGHQQQDSQDMINSLMDILNEWTNNAFTPLFQIRSQQTIKCKLRSCLKKSITTEVNDFLILPVVSSTLDDCYRGYKIHERLDGEEMYFCSHCNAKRVASRRLEVISWPNHLIVFLKRFTNDGARTTKNNTEIDIPEKWRHGYTLKGCVIHTGGINGGHYYYISRIVKENGTVEWYNCNDSGVSRITEASANTEIDKNGYIIYYEKDVK